MKKIILTSILSVGLLIGLFVASLPPKAWSDPAGLGSAAIAQANLLGLYQCTVSGGLPVSGTCSQVGVNWTSLINYIGQNVNWADITGVTGTGALYSNATFIKSNAP